jgi:hypothetical protein
MSNEEGVEYRMFPNAYKFIKLLHQKHKLSKGLDGFSASEILKTSTLTQDSMAPSSGKGKPWNFYISESLRQTDQELLNKL